MKPFRHTKVVCTIGPASEAPQQLSRLLDAGMDVARLNLSHGTLDEHRQRIRSLRELSRDRLRPLAIMLDIQGPKIRLGEFPGQVTLVRGSEVVLTGVPARSPGPDRPLRLPDDPLPVALPELADVLEPGTVVYLDDGQVELAVEAVDRAGGRVRCRVVAPGTVRARKGVALPGVRLKLPALTEVDTVHLQFAAEMDVDLVAASFVRRAEHVEAVRATLARFGGEAIPVIAKIESAEGLEHIHDIVAASDGVMVARGDLGVDIALEEVPMAQKAIIRACNAAGKPVITATQMLESMVHNPSPTRAEVADVANAIMDGTDAVMLSGETAVGKYPVEAVQVMARIALAVERSYDYTRWLAVTDGDVASVAQAISHATCHTATELGVAAILCSTQSGSTARMVARFRPRAPIVAATPNAAVARRLALVWGVLAVVVPRAENIDRMLDVALEAARRTGLVGSGDRVTITAGVKTDVPGSTNLLQVYEVP